MNAARRTARARRAGRAVATAAVLIALVIAVDAPARQQVMTAPQKAAQLASFILSGDALSAARDIGRSGSGEQALPDEVSTMLALVRGHNVRAVVLSPQIAANVLWVQRLTESAFPIRITSQAHDRLALAGEPLPGGCRPASVDHGVVLARCS